MPRKRRWARPAAGVVLLTLALAGAFGFVWARAVEHRIERDLPGQLSKALGWPVSVGKVRLSIWRSRLHVENVTVSGPKDAQLAHADAVDLGFNPFTVMRKNRAVELTYAEVDGLTVNVAREKKGKWNFEPPLKHALAQPGQGQRVHIDRLALKGGVLRFKDADRPLVEARQLEISARDLELGSPATFDVRAALGSDAQNLFAVVSLGHEGAFDVRLRLDDAPIDGYAHTWLPVRVNRLIETGRLSLDAHATRENGRYRVDSKVAITELAIEGRTSHVIFDGHLEFAPGRPPEALRFKNLDLSVPGARLYGEGTLALSKKPRIEASLHGPYVEVGRVLELVQKVTPHRAVGNGKNALHEFSLDARIRLSRFSVGRFTADDLDGAFRFERGLLHVDRADARLFGGKVALLGSEVDLRAEEPQWHLVAGLDGVRLEDALGGLLHQHHFRGEVHARVDVKGHGHRWPTIRDAAGGEVDLRIVGGEIAGIDLARAVAREPQVLIDSGPRADEPDRLTKFSELRARFWVGHGWATLREPLRFVTNKGEGVAYGALSLDGGLDVEGTLVLAPVFAGRTVRNKIKPLEPVEVPIHLSGKFSKLTVSLDKGAIVKSLIIPSTAPKDLEKKARELGRRSQENNRPAAPAPSP